MNWTATRSLICRSDMTRDLSVSVSASKARSTWRRTLFINAFTQNGRDLLEFMRGKPELSFYEAGAPCVQFYYQDENTIKFSSEPYLCSLALTDTEQVEVLRQLSSSRVEAGIRTFQEARNFLHKRGRSTPPDSPCSWTASAIRYPET